MTAANTNFNRGVGFSASLTNALKTAAVNTVFPNSLIGQQLKTVARIMSTRNALGIGRQVFFCQLGGFDTHGAQSNIMNNDFTVGQDPLLQQLSQAVGAFYQATQEVGTDTKWGSHHFVIGTGAASGGALQGGKIRGKFPSLVPGGADDANSRGTLVPTTSVDQYAATTAQWFGVSAANVPSIFPCASNFPTANPGFPG